MGDEIPFVPNKRQSGVVLGGKIAPNSKHRRHATPARRGKGNSSQSEDKTPEQRHQAMTWAQRLKRVFTIDVSVCQKCGGESKVIASIEDQAVIDKILQHLQAKGALPPPPDLLPATRASPTTGRCFIKRVGVAQRLYRPIQASQL
jgi:hypothetical protein